MDFTSKDILYAATLSAILMAVILLAVAIYQFFIEPMRRKKKIDRRLSESGEYLRRAQILKDRAGEQNGLVRALVKRFLGTMRFERLQVLMLQADVYQDPGTFWGRVFLVAGAGFLLGFWILRSAILGLGLACALGLLPFLYLKWKKAVKTGRFEKQMPDAMELLARSLRAGHTLPSAIELLGEEMADPMGTEMRIAYEEQRFGISVQDSLLHMVRRVDSMDLRYFVSAVLIQQETGGNLAELMENIARVVRNRLNFKAKVRALAASGRISAVIMIVAPLVAFVGLMAVAPHYEKILVTSSLGQKMLLAGVLLALLGAYLLRRLIQALES